MKKDFGILIFSHGRAEKLYTINALKKANYTGKWFIVIDDEDSQAEVYKEKYKEHVIQFNKQEVINRTDTMDTYGEHRAIVFARNESFNIAKNLGLKYFMQLDDDVSEFEIRWEKDEKLKGCKVKNLDLICEKMLEWLIQSKAKTVALGQGGDLIGGINGKNFKRGVLRKAMNSFFCDVDNPIEFKGTLNEDVVTYTTLGSRGDLFLTFVPVIINPLSTQSLSGGMTEVYENSGTYMKSFYAVISMPSCVKVGVMHTQHPRMHHNVKWNCCVPKIINERYKK